MRKVRQGDVYWATLPVERMGDYIQKGRRPYLVVSNDFANDSSENVVVVPVTSAKKKRIPTHVDCMTNRIMSTVECEQPMTVGKDLLDELYCIISQASMEKVHEAMQVQFQLKGGRYWKEGDSDAEQAHGEVL